MSRRDWGVIVFLFWIVVVSWMFGYWFRDMQARHAVGSVSGGSPK